MQSLGMIRLLNEIGKFNPSKEEQEKAAIRVKAAIARIKVEEQKLLREE